MPLLKEETYTIDDIYALPDGERAELIDGHMYMMAPPSRKHQRISTRLVSIIDRYIEEHKGKPRIVVNEIPYQVNKARLHEKISQLARDKVVEGITDVRDESNREGIRLVIELKRDVQAEVVLNQLYKLTSLQTTFGVNSIALVNNEPKTLNIKELITLYLEHQEEVIRRRTQFELNKAEARAHILEGLKNCFRPY